MCPVWRMRVDITPVKINLNKLPFLNVGDVITISYSEKEVSEILSLE